MARAGWRQEKRHQERGGGGERERRGVRERDRDTRQRQRQSHRHNGTKAHRDKGTKAQRHKDIENRTHAIEPLVVYKVDEHLGSSCVFARRGKRNSVRSVRLDSLWVVLKLFLLPFGRNFGVTMDTELGHKVVKPFKNDAVH